MASISKGFVPANTAKANNWAYRVFEEWRTYRNRSSDTETCPSNLLENPELSTLNHWLSRFVVKARWEDGNPYPASTIVNLLSGLYRYSRQCDPNCPNFMNRKDPNFQELNNTLQVRFRELQQSGVGTVTKHAPVVTVDEEDLLWESKKIRDDSPKALQRAVFYYVGKTFCLRRGREQQELRVSQFVHSSNPDCYRYVEQGSKNITGANPKVKNKVVPVWTNTWASCHLLLLKRIFSICNPKKSVPVSGPWYENVAVEKEKLRTFLETMCKEAGIAEKRPTTAYGPQGLQQCSMQVYLKN